jgi:REP element-mobilizing transposase RayT
MARIPRHLFPDGSYHVVTRGVDGLDIYRTREDRLRFLRLFARVVRENDWSCHAFCLMTNHYHLVVEALCEQLSAGLHRLNGVYAQRFNERYARRGHLFGDRFWSGLIEGENELAAVCAYVVNNPVRAGLAETAAEWPWSASRYGLDVSSAP